MNNDIIFVGSFVSFTDSKMHPNFSQAANFYQKKFIDFIQPALAISILPIFFNRKMNFSFENEVRFVNNQSGFKNKVNYVYRFVADTGEAFRLISKSAAKHVFFYNLDRQNFMLVMLAKFFLRKKTYVIVADYGYYGKGMMNLLFNKILSAANGVVVLNSNIQCNNNTRLLPGLLYKHQVKLSPDDRVSNNVILSGSLGKTTGLHLALDFFSRHTGYNLYITGRPFRYRNEEFEELMAAYTSPNIRYLGLLNYEEYISVLNKCDIALSLRNPTDDEHEYNFPSKILEYLSQSKFVISTKMYKDIPDGILFYSGYNEASLGRTLHEIMSLPPEAIRERRNTIYTYLKRNFTEEKAVEIIHQLISV